MFRIELIRPLSELLREHADVRGDKVAFRDGRQSVTYADFERRTGRLAGHLADLRLQPGDRAMIYLGNCVETVESYLAIVRANGVGVPLNPHSADAELAYVLDDSGARVVITDPAHLDQVRTMLADRPYLRVVVTGEEPLPWDAVGTVVSYQDLVTVDPVVPARDDQGLEDVAWMLYTSGTTGKPKGVLSTQRSCLWSVAACYAPIVGLSEEDHVLWPLPLHHSLAHVLCVIGVTAVGATARILDGFSANEVLQVMGEESFTFLVGVPAMYHRLLTAAREDAAGEDGVRTGRLQRCLTAGSVCPSSLRQGFEETFQVPLLDGYGSTETCGLITVNWPDGPRVEGSCGLPVPGLAVRLVDPDTGIDVPTVHEGEVWVQGPNLMVGYHNQPEATAAALPGGWYRTGDLARRDAVGFLSITGRVKELIIRSGENIHPGEVEEVLLQVPGVADAAVVGRPHDVLGEVPIAFVVPGSDGIDPEEIYAACREQLSNFKVPEELYETDDIPRTSSGKITRHVLLDRPARLRAAGGSQYESLLRTDWSPLPSVRDTTDPLPTRWAVLGADPFALTADLVGAGLHVTNHPDPAALHIAAVAGEPAPEIAVLCCPDDTDPGGHLTQTADAELRRLADVLQSWVHDDWLADSRLLVVTRGAVATGADEHVNDLIHAPVWGLLRSVQARYPHRFTLLDIDEHQESRAVLALAAAAEEPQLAVRLGVTLAPRLARASVWTERDAVLRLDPEGTVAVTGTVGRMGAVLARHLVAAYGARHVVLISPRGRAEDPTAALEAELTELGAKPAVTACDLTDRQELAAALAKLKRPLTAVIHCDGVPDQGLPPAPTALTEDHQQVFRSIVDGAVNLHQLTKGAGLAAFVTLSSADGALGTAGHDEDAAAHAFLDALAHYRRARGLPALCFAAGASASPQELAAMFDVAAPTDLTQALVMRINSGEPLERTSSTAVPALLRGLIDVTPRLTKPDERDLSALRQLLAGMTSEEQDGHLLDLVRTEMAGVLGLTGIERATTARTFREIGLTSVSAVQLSSRLTAATGLRLPAPVAFDYPTPAALARHLRAELLGERPTSTAGHAPPADTAERPKYALDEPIAIVGMSCRYPGGVRSPEDLWRVVTEGTDVISAFPADRDWDLRKLFDTTGPGERPGTSDTREGGFLYDAGDFDAEFFGISPREAVAMDPQQRVLLETSWEAVERAGIDPATLRGSRTGVFAGVMYHDYGTGLTAAPKGTEGYWTTGMAGSVVTGRIAYSLGLEGPAVTVDTACSSSLVALHWAAQSLRQGECSLALAGGVTVMATPQTFVEFSRQGGLSADGRCKAFSDSADGTGWSEGVGLLVLERLSDAQRNGHRVLAVVRGSAVNQDGASNGLTAPNGPSQQRVIRQALASAGLSASDVDAVEGHGTGTTLGDPIEAQALLATYGQDREQPLLLGSVKSNLGHTQAAAGVAGVIKMVQALGHGTLPRTLHAAEPSSHVDWEAGAVELLTEQTTWPEVNRPRRAGVSSFGVSGTNAHVILEQPPVAPESAPDGRPPVVPEVVPWVVSAKSPAALDEQIERLDAVAGEHSAVDVGFSLVSSRSLFEHRAVLLATGDGLLEAGRGTADEGPLAMLFSGQGSQRLWMGRELYGRFPVFAEAVDAVLAQLDPSLRDVMWGDDQEELNRTGFAQPALFAVEVALFRLVESWGVKPDYLVGHSIGEVSAAHVAGVLSLEDACVLVSARARLMQALPAGGAMVAIEVGEEEVLPHLSDKVSLATVNGPSSVVLAGDESAVTEIAGLIEAEGRKTRRLLVSHAFHSSLMDPMLEDFRAVVEGLSFAEPQIPVVSNLSGQVTTGSELCSPGYWVRHVRETVRFADGVNTLAELGVTSFLELGPDGVLSGMAAESVPEAVVVPVLRRDRPEETAAVSALARLHVSGVEVDWAPFFAGTGARRVDLPTYAFQRRRFWPEAAETVLGSVGDPVDAAFWGLVEGEDSGGLASALELDAGMASVVASALSSWRGRQQAQSVVDSWRYEEAWTPLTGLSSIGPSAGSGSEAGSASVSGVWLVVVPAGEAAGGWVAGVASGLGPDVVRVEVAAGADRVALAEELARVTVGVEVAGVVSLVGVASGGSEAAPAGLGLSVVVVQGLVDAGVEAPLWVVTRGAVSTGAGDVVSSPGQSAVWGLGRVAALELPRRWGGLVDLPEVVDAGSVERFVSVLSGSGVEDQVAVRSGGVFGRRLVPVGPRGEVLGEWRPSGTVLVTGGTGALGGRVARWVVAGGAEHVVLASRRGLEAWGAAELQAELEASGARVTVAACDVADREALSEVLSGIPEELPLTAVVHAAGVDVGDAAVESLSADALEKVLRGKSGAAWHLHELTEGLDLDAFVLFSSGAASWGSGGQPAYAAANAFLDGLAQYRRGLGLTATSIAWGAWADAGMATDEVMAGQLQRHGLLLMDPELALTVLQQAVEDGRTTLTVTNTDWELFAPSFTAERPSPLLSEIPGVRRALSEAEDSAESEDGEPELKKRLAALPETERARVLLDLVRTEAAAVLGHHGPDSIRIDTAFREQGFDSLTGVEMRNRLKKVTALPLPSALAFDHPTPRAVAAYLSENLPVNGELTTGSALSELARFESALWSTTTKHPDHEVIQGRLDEILSRLREAAPSFVGGSSEEDINTVPVDQLLNIIDDELLDLP